MLYFVLEQWLTYLKLQIIFNVKINYGSILVETITSAK